MKRCKIMTPNQKGMVFTKTQKAQHEVIPVAAPLYVQRVPPPVSAFDLKFFLQKLYVWYICSLCLLVAIIHLFH